MPQQTVMPMQQMQPGGYAMQAPQYTPEQLRFAEKKRRSWHFMNVAMPIVQAVVLGLGIWLEETGSEIGVPMILAWVMSLLVCGFISALLRPDDAYLDKKPMFKSKGIQGLMQSIIGTPASAIAAAILYSFLESFF
jgi:hypothetical protein